MMRNSKYRFFLSALALYSIMTAASGMARAAPVQFNQVVQMVNAKPGKASTGGFAQLRLAGDDLIVASDDPKTDEPVVSPQDDPRVITETRSEIIEEEVCNCILPPVPGGFPYYALGLAAVPFLFLIPPGDDNPPGTPTQTPTPPPPTPTPPEPVPEPMTILLFGTGLASIGLVARRRYGKQETDETENKGI